MKKLVFVLFMLLLGFANVSAQSAAEQLAGRIAQKMKDSLTLTDTQKDQLYRVNMQLHDQKMNARQQYAATDSLGIKLQRVENMRDSLYKPVLTEPQFILYKQKKRYLINNN